MKIDGRKLAEEINKRSYNGFKKVPPVVLGEIWVGNDPAISFFLQQKERVARFLGVILKTYNFPKHIREEQFYSAARKIGRDREVQGLIIQPPPTHFNLQRVFTSIPTEKDVDNLSGRSLVASPSVQVVKFLGRKYSLDYKAKKIVLVGFGRLIGQPIGAWLEKQKIDYLVVDKETTCSLRDRALGEADVIISGVGNANLIKERQVKKGVIAIDFGYAMARGKVYGDIDPGIEKKARIFTPTPGGTGPILVAMLYRNLLLLVKKQLAGG